MSNAKSYAGFLALLACDEVAAFKATFSACEWETIMCEFFTNLSEVKK